MMRTHTLVLLLAIIGCVLKGTLGHKNHVVGSSLGWTVPPNKTFYQDWAQKKLFAVGERLVFPYKVGVHNVIEVPKEDFENCTQFKVIERHHEGPLILELTKPGPHYYYCGVGLHCELGQKLAINVSAEAPAAVNIFTQSPAQAPSQSSANIVPLAAPLAALLMYVLHYLFM
ncbi:umecyanin-like [Phoenix dactylifera]|uniref:Umecyanin-like n=1 Tax=Phoenix dactylifera TaxID=42345 RepID=A0A8B7CGB9_PHODC|nr:umecyanin-like [Phoenix dactylifera]